MNRTEAALLIAHCSAFDNRQPSKVAAEAWAAALHDIPYDQDTRDAVAAYYTTAPQDPNQRLWILPHHVRTLRSKIRSARLENFAYEPPDPDETPAEFLARYRGQVEAIASGAVPAPTNRPMLDGPPHRAVAELLSGTVQPADGTPAPEARPPVERPATGPLGVICPDCNAPIGRPCKSAWRHKPRQPHAARRRAAAGDPIRLTTQAEIDARRHLAANHLDPTTEEQP
ncbi:zinc finger domain-containing protein [Streptomyces cinereoruber]|uniref:zinc finger domain-containing protein n=1 Tax=Streptomyces cinereoruber TaxID=67260 RepID=UPI003C2FD3F5